MRFVIGASMMLLVACSGAGSQSSNGADDYEGLFAAPKKPLSTPVTIHGLWSGSIDSADLRMKLEPNKLTVGVRCGEATAGVTIAAEVSASSIRTLESGSAKAGACTLQVRPTMVKSCASATDRECFAISDETKLRLRVDVFTLEQDVPAERGQGPSPGDIPFTKLSD